MSSLCTRVKALCILSPKVIERFKNRKELFNRECEIENEKIQISDLNFTVGSLTNVFYDDKYKLIMCAVPKAATSNWQRVLAVLKYDGQRAAETFHHSNLYNQLNRFSQLGNLIILTNQKIVF